MSEETPTIGHNNPPKVKQKRTRLKPTSEHYANNKEFTKALDAYARNCKEMIADGKERPIMGKYLGQCVIKMATRLSLSPNFRGYVYREEMIQDAILGAVNYMHLFDGNRFNLVLFCFTFGGLLCPIVGVSSLIVIVPISKF